VHHLDSWIKIYQLDITCFIISLFIPQHVSNVSTSIFRSLRLIVDLFHVMYCSVRIEVLALASLFSGEWLVFTCVIVLIIDIIKNTLHTRELKNHRTPQQPNFTETRLLKRPHTSQLKHSPLNKDANAKTAILTEQYKTWNKSTISRELLKMDVLTFETCWAVNGEIIKQVTSSWSVFIQIE